MNTKLIKIEDTKQIKNEELAEAAQILRDGGLVAFPTETVYGLGANALDEAAAKKIYAAKGRPSDNPLIAHISCLEELKPLVAYIPEAGRKLAEAYWPGPLTMVFPKSDIVPYGTTGGLDTVAVRMPSDPVANRLIRLAGVPVAAPSANTSGSQEGFQSVLCVCNVLSWRYITGSDGPCSHGFHAVQVFLKLPCGFLLLIGLCGDS